MLGEGNLNPSHCYQFYTIASSSCPEPGEASQVSRRAPEGQHKGTPASKSASLRTQLKCLHANACSTGNKQEKLETFTHLQGYDLIGITEMWWDGSYDWSVGMEAYTIFSKNRQGHKEEVSPWMSVTSWSAWSSAWRWIRSQPRAYGSGIKAGQGLATS